MPETRPYLQGARLTAWELVREGIPATLITDNMIGHFMQQGAIDCVIVGTDRTAANGDVANKIGTYTSAVLAGRHKVPFYVAAPTTSIDLDCPSGKKIPIEERSAQEVTHVLRQQIAPSEVAVCSSGFLMSPPIAWSARSSRKGGLPAVPMRSPLPKFVKRKTVRPRAAYDKL